MPDLTPWGDQANALLAIVGVATLAWGLFGRVLLTKIKASIADQLVPVQAKLDTIDDQTRALEGKLAAVDYRLRNVEGKATTIDVRVQTVEGKVATIDREVRTNGGKSLKDAVIRVDERLEGLNQRFDDHLHGHGGNGGRRSGW